MDRPSLLKYLVLSRHSLFLATQLLKQLTAGKVTQEVVS
jgi:hypothetical protein